MTLAPGIYKATVRGVADTIVMLTEYARSQNPWVSLNAVMTGSVAWRWHSNEDITDARPLIVLDLADTSSMAARDLIVELRYVASDDCRAAYLNRLLANLADQIEAQTKPARIPEPGLWGVVEGHLSERHDVDDWTRRRQGWHCPAHGFVAWDLIIDPVLIRPGIEKS